MPTRAHELPRGAPAGSYYDADEARKAIAFFEVHLRHFEDTRNGEPFIPQGWQRDALDRIFGFRTADGRRLIRKAFIFLPRGNWKTSFDAGLALKCLVADGHPGQVIVTTGKDKEQAGQLYRYASSYVRADAELSEICECVDSAKRIVVPATGSYLVSVPSDHKGLFGVHPGVWIGDELHVTDRQLVDTLATSQGTVSEPLTIFTTTAGEDPIHSIAGIEYQYAKKTLSGEIIDPTYLALVYEADAKDDPFSVTTQRRANPVWDFAGPTFQKYIAEQAKRAKEQPSFLPTYLTYHLNQWHSPIARWIDLATFDASAGVVTESALKGRTAYCGLDLSATSDLSALALVVPMPDKTVHVVMRFYCPEARIAERSRTDQAPYEQWRAAGYLTATEGNVIDYAYIKRDLLSLAETYRIEAVAYDPWNATQIAVELQAEGIKMIPTRQGFATASEPLKTTEKLIRSQLLIHGGNPVLRYCVSNAVAESDAAGNLKLAKHRSAGRIDGAVALAMAVGRASFHEEAVEPRLSFIG